MAPWFLAPGERDQTIELREIQEDLAGVKRTVEKLEQGNRSRIHELP